MTDLNFSMDGEDSLARRNRSAAIDRTIAMRTLVVAFLLFSTSVAQGASLLVHNGTLVTLEDEQPEPFIGYLLVGEDGRIASLGKEPRRQK